jgi:hypothetical protein
MQPIRRPARHHPSARLAPEEEGYRRIVPVSAFDPNPAAMSRGFCLLSVQVRVASRVRRGSLKKRERQSGGHRAVSHFQTRDGGLGGWVCPLIRSLPFEDAGAQLASVLRDNGTSALAYSVWRRSSARVMPRYQEIYAKVIVPMALSKNYFDRIQPKVNGPLE